MRQDASVVRHAVLVRRNGLRSWSFVRSRDNTKEVLVCHESCKRETKSDKLAKSFHN